MPDLIDGLSHEVLHKLRKCGVNQPTKEALTALLRITYLATLKPEEGRFVRGTVTFARRSRPDLFVPITRRSDYSTFTRFERPHHLTVGRLVKLARAIDSWSGSVAVDGTNESTLKAWGVVDQFVGQNVYLHREALGGFSHPGNLTVTMEGIGELSVYHEDVFLGAIRGQELLKRESEAFESDAVVSRVLTELVPYATAIARVLRPDEKANTQGAIAGAIGDLLGRGGSTRWLDCASVYEGLAQAERSC